MIVKITLKWLLQGNRMKFNVLIPLEGGSYPMLLKELGLYTPLKENSVFINIKAILHTKEKFSAASPIRARDSSLRKPTSKH